MNIKGTFFTASITVALDYIFHLTFTSPMEVPLYFVAKFIVALVIAYFLINKIGILLSAILFTLFFDGYYYLGVLVLHLNYLSSSPNQIIQVGGISDPASLAVLWTFVHGLFFYIGGIFGMLYGGARGR